jgi:hypothetical protein
MVFEIYTQQRLSIKAIARLLNERQIATDGEGPLGAVHGLGYAPQPRTWNGMLWKNRTASGNDHAPLRQRRGCCRAAIVQDTNGRAQSGLRWRCLRW